MVGTGGHLCHSTWGPQTGSLTMSITDDYGFTGSMPHTNMDFEKMTVNLALAQKESEGRVENVEGEINVVSGFLNRGNANYPCDCDSDLRKVKKQASEHRHSVNFQCSMCKSDCIRNSQ